MFAPGIPGAGFLRKIYGFFAARAAEISFLRISLTIFPSTDPRTSLITTPMSGPSAACPFRDTKSDRSEMILWIMHSRSSRETVGASFWSASSNVLPAASLRKRSGMASFAALPLSTACQVARKFSSDIFPVSTPSRRRLCGCRKYREYGKFGFYPLCHCSFE